MSSPKQRLPPARSKIIIFNQHALIIREKEFGNISEQQYSAFVDQFHSSTKINFVMNEKLTRGLLKI